MTEKIRVDCHVHTCYSWDCRMQLDTLVATCIKRKLGCVAVTDHNTIRGALALRAMAPFSVIVGEEIKTSEGELFAYFIEEEIPGNLTPRNTVKAIKEQGGLVGIPHPFDKIRTSSLSERALYDIMDAVDFIEVGNARNLIRHADQKAHQLAVTMGKGMSAGSDCHLSLEVGKCYVLMEQFSGSQDFLDKLKAGTVCYGYSPMIVHVYTKLFKIIQGKLLR